MRIEKILQRTADEIQAEIANLKSSESHYQELEPGRFIRSARLLHTVAVGERIENMRKLAVTMAKGNERKLQ